MKRIACFFAVILMLAPMMCRGTAEDEIFAFYQDVYTAEEGKTARLTFLRQKKSGDAVLLVTDEQGEEIVRREVKRTAKNGTVEVPVSGKDREFETFHLYITDADGEKFFQDTCMTAIYQKAPALKKVETQEKKIAVTFDTANGEGKTQELLALLDKYQIKCTFFVQGTFGVKSEELLREIFARGHELGNHSMHHPRFPDTDNSRIFEELKKCNDILMKVSGGKPVTVSRPPAGYSTQRDRAIARAMGMEVIGWSTDSADGFNDSSRARVWSRLTKHSEPGAVFLMHVYGKHTLDVLEEYIPMMLEKGYSFVTVSELMHKDGFIDENGVQHSVI